MTLREGSQITAKRRHMKRIILSCIFLLLTFTPALAGLTERVRFAPGASGATLKGAVVRGERDVYILGAGAGQWMKVKIYSLEDNAVFQVQNPDGSYAPGAGDYDDATLWNGQLPANGDYRIVVGGTRGNATYTLMVEIR